VVTASTRISQISTTKLSTSYPEKETESSHSIYNVENGENGKKSSNLPTCLTSQRGAPPVEQKPKHHSQPPKSHPGRERVQGGTSVHLWKCSKQQNPALESESETSEFFSVREICDKYSQFGFMADLLIPEGSCEPVPCRSRRSLWKWGLPFAGWEDEILFNHSWALYLSAFCNHQHMIHMV